MIYTESLTPQQRDQIDSKYTQRKSKARNVAVGLSIFGGVLGVLDGPGGLNPFTGFTSGLFGYDYYSKGYEFGVNRKLSSSEEEGHPIRNLIVTTAVIGGVVGAVLGVALAASGVIGVGIGTAALIGAAIGFIGLPVSMAPEIISSSVAYKKGKGDGAEDINAVLNNVAKSPSESSDKSKTFSVGDKEVNVRLKPSKHLNAYQRQ